MEQPPSQGNKYYPYPKKTYGTPLPHKMQQALQWHFDISRMYVWEDLTVCYLEVKNPDFQLGYASFAVQEALKLHKAGHVL